MPFTAPTLHYVAAGEKVLDARPAHSARYSTLDVGHVLRCTDGRHTALVRIRSVMKFDLGFGEAWDYYRSLGNVESLAPSSWVSSLGWSVVDLESAQRFYSTLAHPKLSEYQRHMQPIAVLVFGLEVLSHDIDLEGSSWRSTAASALPQPTQPDMRSAQRQMRVHEVESYIDSELIRASIATS